MQAKVISPLQEDVLTALFDAGLGERGYYLTGRTALAEANLMAAGNLEVPMRMIKPLSNAELRQSLVSVAKELFLRGRPGEPS